MVDEEEFKERWPTLFENVYCGFFAPDEWRDLLWDLCTELETLEGFEDIKVAQVKSKFGGLRFYCDGCSDEASELISKAEAASFALMPDRTTRNGWPV